MLDKVVMELTREPDIAKATLSANRILGMRAQDHTDGKLVSLDLGDLGDEDMGVKIQFRDVSFKYPTRETTVLNGLNMTVNRACGMKQPAIID